MKFGGGVAGGIIGFVLSAFGYDGLNDASIPAAMPGIKMLMSWIPALFTIPVVIFLLWYPLSSVKLEHMAKALNQLRNSN